MITTGGGGTIVNNDKTLARRARHIITTAKVPHAWEFVLDEVGYNYRLPNLNAALGCAQMERLPEMLAVKAEIAAHYAALLEGISLQLERLLLDTSANNWLNPVLLTDREARDAFLEYINSSDAMTHPLWRLMHHLDIFTQCQYVGLDNSLWLEDWLVNPPFSVPDERRASFNLAGSN